VSICVLDELEHLVSLDLRVAFDDIMLDEPIFELGVGPRRKDCVVYVIVVLVHFV
jgi:hypothetical protein